MNRAIVGLDRFLGTLVGILLVIVGVAGILWYHGTLHRRFPAIGVHTHGVLVSIRNATGQAWWPWVTGLVGLVLCVVAVGWLVRHATYRGVHNFRLRGGNTAGQVSASTTSLFGAAADELTQTPGIRSAAGSMIAYRGALVADLRLGIDPAADLRLVGTALDTVVSDLAIALDNPDVTYRASVSVARRPRANA